MGHWLCFLYNWIFWVLSDIICALQFRSTSAISDIPYKRILLRSNATIIIYSILPSFYLWLLTHDHNSQGNYYMLSKLYTSKLMKSYLWCNHNNIICDLLWEKSGLENVEQGPLKIFQKIEFLCMDWYIALCVLNPMVQVSYWSQVELWPFLCTRVDTFVFRKTRIFN